MHPGMVNEGSDYFGYSMWQTPLGHVSIVADDKGRDFEGEYLLDGNYKEVDAYFAFVFLIDEHGFNEYFGDDYIDKVEEFYIVDANYLLRRIQGIDNYTHYSASINASGAPLEDIYAKGKRGYELFASSSVLKFWLEVYRENLSNIMYSASSSIVAQNWSINTIANWNTSPNKKIAVSRTLNIENKCAGDVSVYLYIKNNANDLEFYKSYDIGNGSRIVDAIYDKNKNAMRVDNYFCFYIYNDDMYRIFKKEGEIRESVSFFVDEELGEVEVYRVGSGEIVKLNCKG